MKIKDLRAIINDPMIDEELEVGYADNCIEPTGVQPIERLTEVYNGLDQIVGYVVV
jgi:hypothetical protein